MDVKPQARASAAPPVNEDECGLYAGWRLRLTRPTNGQTVGPRKRSAAGQRGRVRSLCRVAAAPYPAYQRPNRRPAQAQRRRATRTGAVFMPGGGCALPGLRMYAGFVGPRKRSAAGQRGRVRSLCRVAAAPYPAYGAGRWHRPLARCVNTLIMSGSAFCGSWLAAIHSAAFMAALFNI